MQTQYIMIMKIYLIGVLLCVLATLLTEHLYYGNGRSATVDARSIFEDLVYSLLSWLGLLGVLAFYISEAVTHFNNRGYGKYLYDYEESLKQTRHDDQETGDQQ